MGKNISWLFELKTKVPNFLQKLKGKRRPSFYHYSLSGDLFGENIKWGLGNSVFFLKIIYTLDLEKEYRQETEKTIKFIRSFQRKDGSFSDPLVNWLSVPLRLTNSIKSWDFGNILNKQTVRAETRQSISALSLFGAKPDYAYRNFPKTNNKIDKYLSELNWEFPWGAGSHFSHLLFFLRYSSLKNKQGLIEYVIDWINKLQYNKDGFWYKGNPSIQQKINGAMKIITGLKVVDKINFRYPEKIIDNALLAINDKQACDNFNIVYVLKYCNELTGGYYRFDDIKQFMYNRIDRYRAYYFSKIGGFSFKENRAGQFYYGAPVSRGKNEPDIHGTVLFLWGVSIIAQVLGINEKLKFKEFVS